MPDEQRLEETERTFTAILGTYTELTLGYWEIPAEDAALVAELHVDHGPRPEFDVRYLACVDGAAVGKGFQPSSAPARASWW